VLGVVGAGRWGRNHVRNFSALGVLSAICDSSREALEAAAGAFPGVTVYTDLDEVLSDPAVEAVVLATPADLHFAQTEAALTSGRHVLVEKPMTLSLGEAEALDRSARQRGLVFMVGHLLEYHPAFARLRELVSVGELGEVIRIDAHRLSLGTFSHRESVLWDFAPHDLSMILRLLGETPEAVQAIGSSHVQPGMEDVVAAALTFSGGAQAQLVLSWLHPFKEQRLVVVGRRKTAVFDDVVKEGKLVLYPTRVPWAPGQDVPAPGDPEMVPFAEAEPLRAECVHFLHCIRTGEKPLTDGASGVQVARVLDGCERSLRAGGATIELGADPTASR
jgi:UDP-2-acetamido-3-amino-2,3-dideoxy-glucuronate N-acetyltransferase